MSINDSENLKYNDEYYYINTPWRYSGLRITILGFDPICLTIIPFTLISLRAEWPKYVIFAYIAFIMLLVIYAFRKKITIINCVRRWITCYIWRRQWKVR